MNPFRAWLLACRPRTLSAALVPVAVGTGLAVFTGNRIRWDLGFLALFCAAAIQVGTNLFNDALDYRKGSDTEGRIGPMRATQSGLIEPGQVMAGAWSAYGAALVAAIPLVLAGGWPIVAIGLASLVCGYAYTGGPFPLAYRGLGDLFVILFFGFIAVGGVFYLHTGRVDGRILLAGMEVGLLATALLAVNNLRDHEEDSRTGKRTLPVRFGPDFGRAEVTLTCLVPFGLNLLWFAWGGSLAALLPFLSLPLAFAVVRGVHSHPAGPIFNRFLVRTAGLQVFFGGLLTTGMCLA